MLNKRCMLLINLLLLQRFLEKIKRFYYLLKDLYHFFKIISKDLWKASQTIFLKACDLFSVVSLDFIIGKYPNNCFTSGLLHCHADILPNVIYIGCNELFSKISQVVTSEYKIIESNLEPSNKELSVFLHHSSLFCSPYILFLLPLYFYKIKYY